MRKLYYNLAITGLSVAVALCVGGVEALGLAAARLGLAGGWWDAIGAMNDHFGLLGFAIVAVFAAGWGTALLVYRRRSYDKLGQS